MSLFTSIAKSKARQLAEALAGSDQYLGSFLNEYPWAVIARVHNVQITIHVHSTGQRLRIWFPTFRSRWDCTCSLGSPTDASFDWHLPGTDRHGPRVFLPSCLGDENRRKVKLFTDSAFSSPALRVIDLKNDELISLCMQQFFVELTCTRGDPQLERLDAILEFYGQNNVQTCSESFFDACYELVIGEVEKNTTKRQQSGHSFGGSWGPHLPLCRNCKTGLHLLATIDLSDPVIGVRAKRLGRIPIVTCLNCDSYHAPMYVRYSSSKFEILRQEAGSSFDEFPSPMPTRNVSIRELQSDIAQQAIHRLGGNPDWIQSAMSVSCIRCAEDMQFFGQLACDDRNNLQFGDGGRLFVFICWSCSVTATFVQSY